MGSSQQPLPAVSPLGALQGEDGVEALGSMYPTWQDSLNVPR